MNKIVIRTVLCVLCGSNKNTSPIIIVYLETTSYYFILNKKQKFTSISLISVFLIAIYFASVYMIDSIIHYFSFALKS
jgi:hypothetical protein